MNIFVRIGQAISAWLFRIIVLNNSSSLNSIEEYNEFISAANEINKRTDELFYLYNDLRKSFEEIRRINTSIDVELKESSSGISGDNLVTKEQFNEQLRKIIIKLDERFLSPEYADKIIELENARNKAEEENRNLRINIVDLQHEIEELKRLIQENEKAAANPVTEQASTAEEHNAGTAIPEETDDEQIERLIDKLKGKRESKPVSDEIRDIPEETGISYSSDDLFELSRCIETVPVKNNPDSAKNYIRKVLECLKIGEFINNNQTVESFGTYKKNFDSFMKKLKKTAEEILNSLEQLENDEISFVVTSKFAKIINQGMIGKWMPSLSAYVSRENSEVYRELLGMVNNYLESLGYYTYNNLKKGSRITEGDYEYFRPQPPVIVSDSSLNEVVSEIRLLPYAVNYYDSDEIKPLWSEGSVRMYSTEG